MKYFGEPFAVWIGNLGKYNNGALVGEWLELPCTKEEYNTLLEKIGVSDKPIVEYYNRADFELYTLSDMKNIYDEKIKHGNIANISFESWLDNVVEAGQYDKTEQYYEETFNADYNNPFGFDLKLGEYESIKTLNKMAVGLENASDNHVMNVVEALVEEGHDLETSIANSIKNNCWVQESISDEFDVGRYFVNDIYGGFDDLSDNTVEAYFDYAKMGDTLNYNSYEMRNDEQQTAIYDLKEAVSVLNEEIPKYQIKFIDQEGNELKNKEDSVKAIVYKEDEEVETIDVADYTLKKVLADVILPNEYLELADTYIDLPEELDEYMEIGLHDNNKIAFMENVNTIRSAYIDSDYIDRNYHLGSAGEYFCNDNNASEDDIGRAYVEEIGWNAISEEDKSNFFNYEEYGSAQLVDGYSLTSNGLLSTVDFDDNLELDDVLDSSEWEFEEEPNPKTVPQKTAIEQEER